jgi:hypothetical protein
MFLGADDGQCSWRTRNRWLVVIAGLVAAGANLLMMLELIG